MTNPNLQQIQGRISPGILDVQLQRPAEDLRRSEDRRIFGAPNLEFGRDGTIEKIAQDSDVSVFSASSDSDGLLNPEHKTSKTSTNSIHTKLLKKKNTET